jgi:hypothetical protein
MKDKLSFMNVQHASIRFTNVQHASIHGPSIIDMFVWLLIVNIEATQMHLMM